MCPDQLGAGSRAAGPERVLPLGVSRRDGIIDRRSCLDPQAESVEVSTSHLGMAFDPVVLDIVTQALVVGAAAREPVLSPQARLAAVPDVSAG